MHIDQDKKTIIPMRNNQTGEVDFELMVYGRLPNDLLTVPNEVIASLARKYPLHTGDIWRVREG